MYPCRTNIFYQAALPGTTVKHGDFKSFTPLIRVKDLATHSATDPTSMGTPIPPVLWWATWPGLGLCFQSDSSSWGGRVLGYSQLDGFCEALLFLIEGKRILCYFQRNGGHISKEIAISLPTSMLSLPQNQVRIQHVSPALLAKLSYFL